MSKSKQKKSWKSFKTKYQRSAKRMKAENFGEGEFKMGMSKWIGLRRKSGQFIVGSAFHLDKKLRVWQQLHGIKIR